MARFLILSEGGDGCGLAMRLQDEGHDARIWIRELDGEHRCEGLIQKTDDLSFGDIIIADCTGFGQICDSFRESGRLVFGGSCLHDKLESDRKFAKQVMEDARIQTPDSEYFEGKDSWDDAREYVVGKTQVERLVFKPGGRLSGVIPSYVASDSEDMIQMLEFYRQKVGDVEPEFELQEFVEGIAISTEGWFNGHDFIRPFNHTLERKQLMDNDLGPSGGCTGNVVWVVDDEADPLITSLLGLAPFLKERSYVGPIDLNAVVSEEEIYGLEFTPRFGYDAFPTFLLGLFDDDFGYFISSIVRGNSPESMSLQSGFGAGVRITIPPWPNEDYLASPGIPVRGWSASDLKMVYPYDMCLHGENLVTSGGWGIIGVVNGVENSIEDAFGHAYRICKKAQIPDKQYRTDLSEVFQKDFRKVSSFLRELA
jgi:phosphoribosylamine-glycine ligase